MSKGKFIKGTKGNDQLIGSSKNDFIVSGKGNDEINAGAGHDIILSGKGNDVVNGGAGHDLIIAGKGNDIVTGGSGDDCIHLGKGNDTAIYVIGDNVDNEDFYHGGKGHDTLRLEFTKEEWLRPDIQADIAAYLAYLSGNTVPDGYWYNRSTFEFKAFNLTAKQFENLEVVVDGKLLNPADELVDAIDDVVTVSENGTITGNVLDNDDVPDLVKSVELIDDVTKGSLIFNPDGTFSYDTNDEFEELAVGESATQTFTYKVIDADGDEDTATVTLTIAGENDAPVLQYSLTEQVSEDSGAQSFNLIPLGSLTDVDASDTHSVVAASLQQTSGRVLSSAMLNGNNLQYDPNEFNDLAAGESEDLTFTFTITDSNGGEVTQTLDLKITGENDTPTITVVNPDPVLQGNFDPQDQNTTDIQMVDVFAQTTIDDPDASDLQSYVANSIMITADAASATMDQSLLSVDQTTGKVSYDRNAFNFLDDGESAIFNVAYDVMSGPETVTQTLVITITGENDAPQVRRPKLDDIDEDTSLTFSKADLLRRTTEFDLNDQGNLAVFDVELNDLNENDGTLTDNEDNTWTFIPSENFNSDESGRAIRVNFKVSDGTATETSDGNFRVNAVNDAPIITGALEKTEPEDSAIAMLDLLDGASDVEGDMLTVTNLTSPLPSGLTISDSILAIDPTDASFQHLAVGDSQIINLSYDIEDGNGGVTPQTAKITITGTNDDPQVAAIIEHAANEDDASFTVDLLEGASDIDDGEMATLSVVNVSPLPFGLMLNGNTINVDPSHTAFQHLAEGVDEVITVNYEIEDAQGAKVAQTAKITITGKNDLPEVGAIIEKSASEDDDSFIVDLLESASDPDDGETQTLFVANLVGVEEGLVQSGNTVSVDPNDAAFQSLAKDEPYIITLSYDIVDAQGDSTPQTAKITIIGKNDTPEIQSPVTSNSTEDGVSQTVDLLPTGAITDIDEGDVLSVVAGTLSQTGGRMLSSAQLSGNNLTYNPNEFNDLGGAESESLTFTYDVTDSKGGTVTQTLNLTINGENDAPVTTPIDAGQVSEDDAPFIINLLAGQTDPDTTDSLSIENIVAEDNFGNPVTLMNNNDGTITLDPNQYDALNDGENRIVTVTYDVADGTTTTQNTASLEVIGATDNLPPNAVDDVLELGSEFLVNELTDGTQFASSMIELSNGDFVVSWVSRDPQQGDTSIKARIFKTDGTEKVSEFLVNEFIDSGQFDPKIAALSNGGFVVAWRSDEPQQGDTSGNGIKARIFDANGQEVVNEFLVNQFTNGFHLDPQITVLSNGNFVISWHSIDALQVDTNDYDIKARIFDANGQEVVSEFLVNEFTDFGQGSSSIAALSNGGFVVTWNSGDPQQGDTSGSGIKARIFDANGQEVVSEFLVNQFTNGIQIEPEITVLSNGNFVISWSSYDVLQVDTSDYDIKARIFDATGQEVVSEFLVNQFTNDNQYFLDITALANGGFVVAWRSDDPQQGDTSGFGIKARIFDANGQEVVSEFLVNEFTNGIQSGVAISALSNGGFVVTWNSGDQQQGAISGGIKARIFDANGNPKPTSNIFLEDQIGSIQQSDLLANDTDPDGDPFTITEVSATSAKGAAVTLNNDGTISYDPTSATTLQALGEGETTTDTFTYTITDGNGEFDTATVTVTILGQNDTPIAEADTYILNEDGVLNVGESAGVLRNDDDADEGDILTATLDQDVNNGTLIFNSDGSFKYTPNLNFNGEDSFTYILSDGTETTTPIEVTLTVNPINDAPVVTGGQIIVDEDQSHTITLADLGYSDVDGDELSSITINSGSISSFKLDNNSITAGQQITLAQINAGLFTFAPPLNFNGTGSISFTASDGLLTSTPASLAFEVTPVNDTPVAVDDEFAVNANEVLTVAADGVLDNDSDVDATDTLTVSNFQATSTLGATVIVNADGSLSYDATGVAAIQALGQGETQDDTFTYNISDGNGGQDTATVTVTVTGVNDAPEAVMDSAMVNEDGTVLIDVLGNDSDPNGDALTISDVSTPTNGMAVIEDGQIRYRPNGNFSGIDTFTYTIDDGRGGTDTATVNVTINPIADEPTLTAEVEGRLGPDSGVPFNILAEVIDTDGSETITEIRVIGLPAGVSLSAGTISEVDGSVLLTPSEFDGDLSGLLIFVENSEIGDFPLTIEATVTDTASVIDATDTFVKTIDITVDVNERPNAVDDIATVDEDDSVEIYVLQNDTDPEGDDLTLTLISSDPSNGTAEIQDGKILYTPKPDFSGQDSFTYQIQDEFGAASNGTVTVNVTPVNDAPSNLTISGNNEVPENIPGALVGVLSVDDPDVGDTITYSFVPGQDRSLFTIVGDELRVGESGLDFEQFDTRTVTVRATDSIGEFVDQTITISIFDSIERELTTSADNISPSADNLQIRGNVLTLTSDDDLDGGDGFDSLALFGSGTFDLSALTGFQNFEEVRLVNITNVSSRLTLGDEVFENLIINSSAQYNYTLNDTTITGLIDGSDGQDNFTISGDSTIGTINLGLTSSEEQISLRDNTEVNGLNLGGGSKRVYLSQNSEIATLDLENSIGRFDLSSASHISNIIGGDGRTFITLSDAAGITMGSLGDGNDGLTIRLSSSFDNDIQLDGGEGIDTLQFSGVGEFDLSAANLTGFESLFVFSSRIVVDNNLLSDVTRIGGDGTIITSETELDLTGKTLNGTNRFESNNATGTTFKVDDKSTALNILGGPGDDTLDATGLTFTALEREAIFGASSIETIIDDEGIYGNNDPNILQADSGGSSLFGGGGADQLFGDDGDDFIIGGSGDDLIIGGSGNDQLEGNADNDTFVFAPDSDQDLIIDFTAGENTDDLIDLTGFSTATANTVVANAMTQTTQDTVLDFGNGDTLTLEGVVGTTLHSDDFIIA